MPARDLPPPIEAPPRLPMAEWYVPSSLLAAGVQVLVSTLVARRSDFRLVEALGPEQPAFDYSDRGALWIDYVADTGDGFDPAASIACLVGDDALRPAGDIGEPDPLRRGELLVLGGDQVYPTPSERRYHERLVTPLSCAHPGDVPEGERPTLFALPGDHDWYDGLSAFTRLFCQGRVLAGFRTRQRRSYFALRLPHHHWLLGFDTQLENDIDFPQLDYFRRLPIEPGDHVVWCVPEAHWIERAAFGPDFAPAPDGNLAALESDLAARGAAIVLRMSGHFHHYRRHERPATRDAPVEQLVTAGGGGAFLHPTHAPRVDDLPARAGNPAPHHRLAAEYPPRAVTRALGRGLWRFFALNPRCGVVTAIAYVILSWVMPDPAHTEATGPTALLDLVMQGAQKLSQEPGSLVWFLLVLLGFAAFTDRRAPRFRGSAGLVHGLVHLVVALCTAGLAAHVVVDPLTDWLKASGPFAAASSPLVARLALTACVAAGGYVFGSIIVGLYLLVSVNVLRRSYNEAFAALRITGWKSFVRLRVDARGISAWAIGIDEVATEWRWTGSRYTPTRPLRPRVIDRFAVPKSQ